MSALEDLLRTIVREVVLEELPAAPRLPQPLLSAEQVGELLGGIDAQAVYRLKRENQLKAVHLSATRFKFHPDEVERFIREGGVKPLRVVAPAHKVSRGGSR